ncbi:Hpt domain-containing protein [Granulicella rosea]|uniref:Hpt domain-containing protein n=2 Tax=Granulicella rosea TaxID=474952 RepID=A0A239DXZ5_9BACT|nr:Hpt domain-containing protein [Granulicella rosea]
MLAALWQKNQPLMLERLDLLDRASTHPELHEEAIAVAHKMAGTLGMFGFPEGTAIAREIELALEAGNRNISHLAARLRALLFPTR